MQLKTCLRAYGDSEGQDQPVHLHSLIRAFAVRKQNHWILQNVSMKSKCPDETLRMYRLMWIRIIFVRSKARSRLTWLIYTHKFVITCETTAMQTIHLKLQDIFESRHIFFAGKLVNKNEYFRMSPSAVLTGPFNNNEHLAFWVQLFKANDVQKLLTFFQQKISEYCVFSPLKQLTKWPLTSSLSWRRFEQLSPG